MPRERSVREMARSRVREVLTTANDPLAVLIEIANDREVDVQVRVQAAIGAAPFMFPRLSASVVATAPMNAKDDTAGLIERLMTKFQRLAAVQTIEGVPAKVGAD
jgi:hypothetical protein